MLGQICLRFFVSIVIVLIAANAHLVAADAVRPGLLDVQINAVKNTYGYNEPVDMNITITNTSDRHVIVSYNYPERMGLHAAVQGSGNLDAPGGKDGVGSGTMRAIDGHLRGPELAPNEKKEISFALNRYLDRMPRGDLRVKLDWSFMVISSSENEILQFASEFGESLLEFRRHRQVAQVANTVDRYLRKLESNDDWEVRQALEILAWTDDLGEPFLNQLMMVANRSGGLFRSEIIDVLESNWKSNVARKHVDTLALTVGPQTLRKILRIWEKHDESVKVEFLRVRSSESDAYAYAVLEWIEEHPSQKYASVALELLNSSDAGVRSLARDALDAIQRQIEMDAAPDRQ